MRLMMFVLIASVLSRVAHTKNCWRQKKPIIHYGVVCKKQGRGRDRALREFDISPVTHINIKNRPRPWTLVKTPIDSRNAMREYIVLI
jgi:hypothetical protein